MTNVAELLKHLQDVRRNIELCLAGGVGQDELCMACGALADIGESESREIASAARDLAEAAKGDMQDGTFSLHLQQRLQTLMVRIQASAESTTAGHIWAAGQDLAKLLLVAQEFIDDAPGPLWSEEFPPALCSLEAVRMEMPKFVSLLEWPPLDQFGLEEIDRALQYATELIAPAPEAPLCQYLASASADLDRNTHIAWIKSHVPDGREPNPSEVYAWYWNETQGGAALDEAKVRESAATVSAVAKAIGLDEVMEYLGEPDQVAFYGLQNILPSIPIRWSLESVDAATRHLHSGLARWYFNPFKPSLAPLDLIVGLLRARRPYYYHKMLAHSLVQTVCVQHVLPAGTITEPS